MASMKATAAFVASAQEEMFEKLRARGITPDDLRALKDPVADRYLDWALDLIANA